MFTDNMGYEWTNDDAPTLTCEQIIEQTPHPSTCFHMSIGGHRWRQRRESGLSDMEIAENKHRQDRQAKEDRAAALNRAVAFYQNPENAETPYSPNGPTLLDI